MNWIQFLISFVIGMTFWKTLLYFDVITLNDICGIVMAVWQSQVGHFVMVTPDELL